MRPKVLGRAVADLPGALGQHPIAMSNFNGLLGMQVKDRGNEPTYASEDMPTSATGNPAKSRGSNLLQEFENSLPDFQNLDERQHLEFVKAIRLLCRYFGISEARLRRDHFFKFGSTIADLKELHEEYFAKNAVLASAILIVKLHIESHYLDGEDANLVRNLTGLHIYPRIPLDCAPDQSVPRERRRKMMIDWAAVRGLFRASGRHNG